MKENIQDFGRYSIYIINLHFKIDGSQDCFGQDVPTNTLVSITHKIGLLTQVNLSAELPLPQGKRVTLVAWKSAATGPR